MSPQSWSYKCVSVTCGELLWFGPGMLLVLENVLGFYSVTESWVKSAICALPVHVCTHVNTVRCKCLHSHEYMCCVVLHTCIDLRHEFIHCMTDESWRWEENRGRSSEWEVTITSLPVALQRYLAFFSFSLRRECVISQCAPVNPLIQQTEIVWML